MICGPGEYLKSVSLWIVLFAAACDSKQHDQSGSSAAPGTTGARSAVEAERHPGSQQTDTGFAAANCDSIPDVVCFRGKAYAHDVDYEPGRIVYAHWIWFGSSGDSIEILARADSDASHDKARIVTNLGMERNSDGNTASVFHHRLKSDGIVEVWVNIDDVFGDTVGYALRIRRRDGSRPAMLLPTGQSAALTISSPGKRDRFRFVPLSIAARTHDEARWTVFAGTYNVALISDSLYELCRVPCSIPDTVKLTPSATVAKMYP